MDCISEHVSSRSHLVDSFTFLERSYLVHDRDVFLVSDPIKPYIAKLLCVEFSVKYI